MEMNRKVRRRRMRRKRVDLKIAGVGGLVWLSCGGRGPCRRGAGLGQSGWLLKGTG